MKKLMAMLLAMLLIMQLAACGAEEQPPGETIPEASTGPETSAPEVPEAAPPEVPGESESEWVYQGTDRIVFDNSQSAYGFVHTKEYISVLHALMQAEALRDPECFTLQIENGEINKDNYLTGYLHWNQLDFNTLKVNFANKELYTFFQNNEIPKLEDSGPLGLLFEDNILDPNNLTLMVTDLMENSFGGSQIAAQLSELLTAQPDVGLTIYGIPCTGFSGNMSYPSYNAKGAVVRTVLNYRGKAMTYLVALGPVEELMDFDKRLAEALDPSIELLRASYINNSDYIGETGIGELTLVQSLAEKVKDGHAGTLNYTVHAQAVQNTAPFVLTYTDEHTIDDYAEQMQITMTAPVESASPFLNGSDLRMANQVVQGVAADGTGLDASALELDLHMEMITDLPVWKTQEGEEAAEKTNSDSKIGAPELLAEGDLLLLQMGMENIPAGSTWTIAFDLVTDAVANAWVADKTATIYEYQTLTDILPVSPDNTRHLRWTANATDILSRTLDLADIDTKLSQAVPAEKVVRHVELTITREAETGLLESILKLF